MQSKYIVGGAIVVVFFVAMGFLLTQSSVGYEENFTVVKETGEAVRATGAWVREKSYFIENERFTFYIVDAFGEEMKVEYDGGMPPNFESSTSVVVTGRYEDGVFKADNILTKCPSKYEEKMEETSGASM
ncbi:MAG: cytochrome c maturation protein CcmE [Ignavibacteriales bacterium]|nr:cytochrome c maturation protein CcmE [Ignavibacteriales bacterium]